MKVVDLIEQLRELDPELEVVFDRMLLKDQIIRIDGAREATSYHRPGTSDYADKEKRGWEPVRVAKLS